MANAKTRKTAVGIDLGTTTSCAAYYENEELEIIVNEQGNGTTPSYVAFTETEILVGEAAKLQQLVNTENTVFDGKRLIGRKYDDPAIQKDLKIWPFKVVNQSNCPKLQVTFKGKPKQLFPEEISAKILRKLADLARDQIGEVKDAVITVPAYFNDLQRQATKDAARIAELNVMRLISEPTAAAIAYGLDRVSEKKHVLVYDLGGGTFDVSILLIENREFKVLATNGDTHLGGEDFDRRLVEYLVDIFKQDHQKDLLGKQNVLARLRVKAKEAKELLTKKSSYNLKIQDLEGTDFQCEITREKFENLNKDLFEQTLKCVKKAVQMASLDMDEIDEILLVGGSSRIPKIQQMITQCFNGKTPSKGIHPDEAVARGAAIMASVLSGDSSKKFQDVAFYDVLPLSLGIQVRDGEMSTLLARNTSLPASKSETYRTMFDQQVAADIVVYEGERPLVKDNHQLGEFTVHNIPPKPPGQVQIIVTFSVDEDAILNVKAKVLNTGTNEEGSLTIHPDKGLLSPEEIQRLISEAKEHRIQDEEELDRVRSKNMLQTLAFNLRSYVKRGMLNVSNETEADLMDKCSTALEWMDENKGVTKYEYDLQLKSLLNTCHSESIDGEKVLEGSVSINKADTCILYVD